MIDVLQNSKLPLKKYNLVSNNKVVQTVKLTEFEAKTKNYAFGLNHVNKRYVLNSSQEEQSGVFLVLP